MRRMKKIGAIVLAAVLVCSAFVLPEVYAAVGVEEPEEGCSLQINCNVQNEIKINIYKVADIQVTGKYEPVAGLSGLDGLKSVNSETKAKTWQELAAAAKAAVKAANMDPTRSAENVVGSVTFTELPTGMYLIDAQRLLTPEYRYEFTPYLISLPNNYFYSSGNDAWDYDLIDNDTSDEGVEETTNHAIGLKPQQFDRFGYVIIKKELTNYDETNPSAVFVFEVKAVKDDDVVYNDVVALDFTAPGSDWVKVGPIKAGATVTVTEVYQGANYIQDSVAFSDNPFVIRAESIWDDWDIYTDTEKETQKVELAKIRPADITAAFTNKHNDVPNGGTGVVNTFTAGSQSVVQGYQGQNSPEWKPETP